MTAFAEAFRARIDHLNDRHWLDHNDATEVNEWETQLAILDAQVEELAAQLDGEVAA